MKRVSLRCNEIYTLNRILHLQLDCRLIQLNMCDVNKVLTYRIIDGTFENNRNIVGIDILELEIGYI